MSPSGPFLCGAGALGLMAKRGLFLCSYGAASWRSINAVTLAAIDLDASAAFYRALGVPGCTPLFNRRR